MNESKLVRLFAMIALLIGSGFSARAEADPAPRLIVVVNRADWCSVCKAHGERAGKAVMAASAGAAIQIVINDLTSDATAKQSVTALKAAGVEQAMRGHTATGLLTYFDPRTKRQLRQITVANTDDEIKRVTTMALHEASP